MQTLVAAVVLCLGADVAAAGGILGSTAGGEVRVDGFEVPSGTTLVSPSVLLTGEAPGLVHLRGGHSLVLATGSEARLESAAAGGIRLAVESGAAELTGPGGSVVRLASNEAYLLDDESEIGEGQKVELVRMCTPDEDDEDEWEPIDVPPGEVDGRLAAGDVLAGTENNDLGLDEDCDEEAAGFLASTGGRALLAVGGSLAVLGLIEEDEASP